MKTAIACFVFILVWPAFVGGGLWQEKVIVPVLLIGGVGVMSWHSADAERKEKEEADRAMMKDVYREHLTQSDQETP